MTQLGTNPIAWANDDDQSRGADTQRARIQYGTGRLTGLDWIEAEQGPDQRKPQLYQTLGLHTLKRIARETGLTGV